MSASNAESSLILTYDARQLAKVLSVSLRHIRRMDASGRLPKAVRLGRSKRWLVDTIRTWLLAGCPPRDVGEAKRKTAGKEVRYGS